MSYTGRKKTKQTGHPCMTCSYKTLSSLLNIHDCVIVSHAAHLATESYAESNHLASVFDSQRLDLLSHPAQFLVSVFQAEAEIM